MCGGSSRIEVASLRRSVTNPGSTSCWTQGARRGDIFRQVDAAPQKAIHAFNTRQTASALLVTSKLRGITHGVYSGPEHSNESVGTPSPTPVVPLALGWDCLAHSRLWSSCRHHGDGGYGDDAGPEPQSRRLRDTRWRDPLAEPRTDRYRHLANSFAESPEAAGLKPAS
jgi:hypothetical protein